MNQAQIDFQRTMGNLYMQGVPESDLEQIAQGVVGQMFSGVHPEVHEGEAGSAS